MLSVVNLCSLTSLIKLASGFHREEKLIAIELEEVDLVKNTRPSRKHPKQITSRLKVVLKSTVPRTIPIWNNLNSNCDLDTFKSQLAATGPAP